MLSSGHHMHARTCAQTYTCTHRNVNVCTHRIPPHQISGQMFLLSAHASVVYLLWFGEETVLGLRKLRAGHMERSFPATSYLSFPARVRSYTLFGAVANTGSRNVVVIQTPALLLKRILTELFSVSDCFPCTGWGHPCLRAEPKPSCHITIV